MITADTNVFIYGSDPRNPVKRAAAKIVIERLATLASPIALQLVGEFQNVLRRKLRFTLFSAATAAEDVLLTYTVFPASMKASHAALSEMAAGRLSYWDALMLASAAEAGCTVMLSEDMQDGGRIFGVEIVNPFGAAGVSARAAELLHLA